MRGEPCNGCGKTRAPTRLLQGLTPAYRSQRGACYLGDCRQLLAELPDESVSLVFTSPPFALRREKAYGSPALEHYVEWFVAIASEIRRVLRRDGNFVMELGAVWDPGLPTLSVMPCYLELELRKLFHLAEEFSCYNPRRLPGPTEWVNKRRWRVKDAVTQLRRWAKIPEAWCDQRAVLVPYKREVNETRTRSNPSGHVTQPHTWHDNGGAIPPNHFTVPGLDGHDPYARHCRAAKLPVHPARMPDALPEFFVQYLTRPGDVVLDPFAGSNTTGAVAERLKRRWLSFEIRRDYVAGSRLRFDQVEQTTPATS